MFRLCISFGVSLKNKMGVIYVYEMGRLHYGTYRLFCHKQKGIDILSSLLVKSNGELLNKFITVVDESILEQISKCDCKNHILTEDLSDYIADYILTQCVP